MSKAKESPPSRARTGQRGEREAARLLRRKGFKILARNWRRGRLELDLVCREGPVLVFVEVRTRQSGARIAGFDSLSRPKKQALKRAASAYLQALRNKPDHFRFDLVEVTQSDTGDFLPKHFENIDLST
ncbi:MAG: YraN family protein [Opitutales bacterium]